MRISVLGAGAWGTALAAQAAQRHATVLWGRDAAQMAHLASTRRNARYLDAVALPDTLQCCADLAAALAHCSAGAEANAGADADANKATATAPTTAGLIVIATPMAGLRAMLQRVADQGVPAVWLGKGFEAGSGQLGHEIAREVAPHLACGVLSGPSFALEVARNQPTALVCASQLAEVSRLAVQAFHGANLRVYSSTDPVGVEVGGAVKNVLAIATGIADGMGLGLNARAALITRGLAEMSRLGVALGAQVETFMGLSGLGDLVLTATGDLSRNRRVGLLLAEGRSLDDILHTLGHVAEGVYSARTVWQRAQSLGVDMPISAAVVDVLEGRSTPRDALIRLMGRDARAEQVG
jgi:glycerol-3-phosphate dehydrogenase (NAD(P)+)